ncbi:MAG: ImmA/IrrE family metallo-endopeptidase [Sporolactobacillus sp.]|nr:ImmA/IrrE family metallo-endopeptidase [Sporolactobacillus sp.]
MMKKKRYYNNAFYNLFTGFFFCPKIRTNVPYFGDDHMSPYDPPIVEKWVTDRLTAADILYPDQLEPEHVAEAFGVDYSLWNGITFSYRVNPDGQLYIVDNAKTSNPERRFHFFHELAHALRHAGDQRDMVETFRQAQEWDANLCAMYAAVPFHMIDFSRPYNVQSIMETFTVTKSMATKRIHDIRAKIYWESRRQYEEMVCEPAPPAYDLSEKSPETQRIMNQLKNQLERKGERLEIHDLL